MLNKSLEKICKQSGCITFGGCSAEDITNTNNDLQKNGFCPLPAEYAEFLKIYNGIIYDGLELLGTIPHKRSVKNYTLSSILNINLRYARIDYFSQKLILGELPESFLIFDMETSGYEIVDRLNLDSRRTFNTFNELFNIILPFLVIKD